MSVLEAIHKHKVRSLTASINFREKYDQAVSDKVAYTVRRLRDGEVGINEESLYDIYTQCLKDYHGKRFRIPTKLTNVGRATWRRALERYEEAGVPALDFVRAQFAFFSKHFGKAPDPKYFTTDKAVDRAKEYAGTGRISSSAQVHTSEFSDLMQWADKQVRDMCKAQGLSREDFYREFVVTGMVSLPQAYLEADPVYCSIIHSDEHGVRG